MGFEPDGTNPTRFGDFRDGFSPAGAGDGFEDQGLSDFAHFTNDFLEFCVIVDGLGRV